MYMTNPKNKVYICGVNLRFERRVRRHSQSSFASRLGISQQKYSLIERGEYSPSVELFERILKEFGLSIEVIGGDA